MVLFNCVPFHMGISLRGKNLLPEGANSFLYEQFLIVWTSHLVTSIECYYFITHVRNLRNGCCANDVSSDFLSSLNLCSLILLTLSQALSFN